MDSLLVDFRPGNMGREGIQVDSDRSLTHRYLRLIAIFFQGYMNEIAPGASQNLHRINALLPFHLFDQFFSVFFSKV